MREVMKVVVENAERHALRRLGVPDEEEYELAQRALELEEAELRDEEVHFPREYGEKKDISDVRTRRRRYGVGRME